MSKKIFYMLFIALIVICGLATGTAQATNYYVDCNGGDDDYNGLSWPTAFATIQKGLDTASDGDTIDVNECTYYESIDFDDTNCTLRSTNPNDWNVVESTIIDANGSSYVVTFENNEDANAILTGFTLQDSFVTNVYCFGTSPSISRCIIRYGFTYGVYCIGSGCSATITHNKISDNEIGIGPIISSSPTITNNIIHSNSCGVVLTSAGYVKLLNNTIANNSSYGVSVTNSTAPDINSCIIWDNNDDLNGCSATYSCIEDGDAGTGNISSDPCFVDANANDFHLKDYSSPCIDAGDPNFTDSNEVDIDNQSRLTDGDGDGNSVVDMGADEIPEICQTCNGDVVDAGDSNYVSIPDAYYLVHIIKLNNVEPITLSNPLYLDCGDYNDIDPYVITANDANLLIADLEEDMNGWPCQ
jgi:parallel beta-helix repeat protein